MKPAEWRRLGNGRWVNMAFAMIFDPNPGAAIADQAPGKSLVPNYASREVERTPRPAGAVLVMCEGTIVPIDSSDAEKIDENFTRTQNR